VLVLFSIGITKGKWGTLLNALLDFKRDYDSNTPLSQVLPDLPRDHPARYGSMGCASWPMRCSRRCATRGAHTGSPRHSRLCRRR
jgi:arginine/lysine/ornithine decarboxylase